MTWWLSSSKREKFINKLKTYSLDRISSCKISSCASFILLNVTFTFCQFKYACNHKSCPLFVFMVCCSSEAHELRLYSSTDMYMSNCTLLGYLEPHQCSTWPSAYSVAHAHWYSFKLTWWLKLHLIRGPLPTQN